MSDWSKTVGRVSLGVAVSAVAVPFLVPLVINSLRDFFWMYGPYCIWALEVISLVLGIIGRKSTQGKVAIAVSVLVSLLLLGYLTFSPA